MRPHPLPLIVPLMQHNTGKLRHLSVESNLGGISLPQPLFPLLFTGSSLFFQARLNTVVQMAEAEVADKTIMCKECNQGGLLLGGKLGEGSRVFQGGLARTPNTLFECVPPGPWKRSPVSYETKQIISERNGVRQVTIKEISRLLLDRSPNLLGSEPHP